MTLTRWVSRFRNATIALFVIASVAMTVGAQADEPPVSIHYSPQERLDGIDVQLINTAKSSIDIAAYVLSDWGVIDVRNAAPARGVVVRVVLDPREHSDTGRMAGLQMRMKHPGPLMRIKSYEI